MLSSERVQMQGAYIKYVTKSGRIEGGMMGNLAEEKSGRADWI